MSHHNSLLPCLAALARGVSTSLCALLIVTQAHANLRWENVVAQAKAIAGDPEAIGYFRYDNPGRDTVTILSVVTDCDCTAAEPSKRVVGPGEAGFLTASLDLTNRVGRLQKKIIVTTDQRSDAPTELTFRVDVADVVTATPHIVVWRVSAPAEEKTIELEATAPYAIRELSGPTELPGVTLRLDTLEAGKKYRLHIRPDTTTEPKTITIHYLAHLVGRPPVFVLMYAVVR